MSPNNHNQQSEHQPLLSSKKGSKGKLLSTRYILSYMAFLGFVSCHMARVNISVAITAMVNSTYSTDYSQNVTAEICPSPNKHTNKTGPDSQEGEFQWDAHTQELILAAHGYGFFILQIPAGVLADKYPKSCTWIFGLGFFFSSIFTLLTPLAAYHSVTAIFITRFACGLAESGYYPASYALMNRWAPPADRSTMLAIVFSGMPLGQMVAQPITGLLAESKFGWESAFYLYGTIGCVWFVFWIIFAYDSPQSHPRISQEEKDYIIAELQTNQDMPRGHPWKSILTSPAVYSVAVGEFAVLWLIYTMSTNLPIFLKEAQGLDVTAAGSFSALPHLGLFLVTLVGGFLADFLIENSVYSRTTIRKIMTSVGLIPSAIFMAFMGYTGCNSALAITFASLGLAFTGMVLSGASLTQMEFAPPYAGLVTAFSNTIATISGFMAPFVVGIYTENQADLAGWRTVFWISFGISIFAEIFFLIFGTSQVQSWASLEEKNLEESSKYEDIS